MWYHNGVLHVSKTRFHEWLVLRQTKEEVLIWFYEVILSGTVRNLCLGTSKTSRPTRNMGFTFKCSTSAASSITGPLLQLMRIASWWWSLSNRFKQHLSQTWSNYSRISPRRTHWKNTFFIIESLSLFTRWYVVLSNIGCRLICKGFNPFLMLCRILITFPQFREKLEVMLELNMIRWKLEGTSPNQPAEALHPYSMLFSTWQVARHLPSGIHHKL